LPTVFNYCLNLLAIPSLPSNPLPAAIDNPSPTINVVPVVPAVDTSSPPDITPSPAVDSPQDWKCKKDLCQSILLKKAAKYELRLLKATDHMPEDLKKQIFNFGSMVLIREGNERIDPDNPLRDCLEYSLGIDPNLSTFLVCFCPWTGDEFWIGFGVGDHIGDLLEKISDIESKIGREANNAPVVKRQEGYAIQCATDYVNANSANSKARYTEMKKAESDLLSLKAVVAARLREMFYQAELDELRGKIVHLQTKLHNISAQFLSAWSLLAIPRFDLKNIVKCGGKQELGDKQKAILSYLAHCKFLTRLRTAAAKHNCDIAEVTESGSTKNCSKCNAKNSPRLNRFYHCRNCKSKLTRDGNSAKNIFKMALATVLIYLNDRYPLWEYLHRDDDDDESDMGSYCDEMDEWDYVIDDEEFVKKRKRSDDAMGDEGTEPIAKRRRKSMSGSGSKDDEAGGESGAGKSRVVGSDNMEDHEPLLSSNVLPLRLKSQAAYSQTVVSQDGKPRISIQPL
jgi:ribosomal protein L40E